MQLLKDLEQGSQEWSDLRKTKIGASDSGIIMGVNPWCSPYQLWCEKLGITPPKEMTYPMRRGMKLEAPARLEFQAQTGFHVKPAVALSDDLNFILASFDGLSEDRKIVLEIKCPGKADHEIAKQGYIPPKYIYQLQHQIFVAEVDEMQYFSYDGNAGVCVTVRRDQSLIDIMLKKEKEFFDRLQNFIAPEKNP